MNDHTKQLNQLYDVIEKRDTTIAEMQSMIRNLVEHYNNYVGEARPKLTKVHMDFMQGYLNKQENEDE